MGFHTMLCLSKTPKNSLQVLLMPLFELMLGHVLAAPPNNVIIQKRFGTISYGL